MGVPVGKFRYWRQHPIQEWAYPAFERQGVTRPEILAHNAKYFKPRVDQKKYQREYYQKNKEKISIRRGLKLAERKSRNPLE
jgi:hypothetical protein